MNQLAKQDHIFVYTEKGAIVRRNHGENTQAGDPVDLPSGNRNQVKPDWIEVGFVKEVPISCTGCQHIREMRPEECNNCKEFSNWEE